MKPVPRHRTEFEFIQSIMDPLTFEKNFLVKYPFFPLTLKLDIPKIVIRFGYALFTRYSTILTIELNCQKN